MTFCNDIHVSQRKNPNGFGDFEPFPLAPAVASQQLKIYNMDYTKKYVSQYNDLKNCILMTEVII